MLWELGLQCNLSADAHATADALVDPLPHNLSGGVAAVGEACEQARWIRFLMLLYRLLQQAVSTAPVTYAEAIQASDS